MAGLPTFEEFQRERQSQPTQRGGGGGLPTFEEFQQGRRQEDSSLTEGSVASVVEGFKTGVNDLAAGGMARLGATDDQLANLFLILDGASRKLSEATGLSRGGAFGRVRDWFREQGQALKERAANLSPDRPGVIDDLNRFAGGLPVDLPVAASAVAAGGPVLGFAGLGALTEADQGLKGAALGAAKGALSGKVFEVAAPLGRLARAGAVTSGVAAIESAAGAEPGQALQAGAVAGILAGSLGGPGQPRPREGPIDLGALRVREKAQQVQQGKLEQVEAGKPRIRPKTPLAERPLVEVSDQAKATAEKAVGGEQPTRVVLDDGRVLNLNLRRIKGPQDLKDMQRFLVEEFRPQINEARRGEITHLETQRTAETLGLTPEEMLHRQRGKALNAEELTAFRVLHQSIAKELFDRARLVRGGEATDVQKADFINMVALYEASAKQTLGATAEAGRALSSLRIIAGPSRQHLQNIRDLMSQFKEVTHGKEVEAFADMLSRLEDPGALTQAVEAARKPTLADKFIEVYVNGLLTNPKTHMVNLLSNTLTALWAIPEAYTAAAFSGLSSRAARLAGRPKAERVFLREGNARLWGFVEGAKDGLKIAAKTFRTGETSDAFGKIESRRGAVEGRVGKLVRVPGDLLLASDEFFKSIGMRQEIQALAVRRAAGEGLRGQEFRNRAASLIENPPPSFHEAAVRNARRQTFTEPLGEVGRAVVDFSNSHPLFKIVLPFVRTPVNIFKFSAKRSPVAPFFADVRANLRAGGAVRDAELARMALGTMAGTVAGVLAAEGYLTGSGPADPETRAAWFAADNRPYSFRLSTQPGSRWNEWISFGRLEPAGTILGVGADLTQISGHLSQDELDEAAALVVLSFRKNVENKTFLQGLTQLMLATSDPDQYGERFLGSLVTGLVPASSLTGEVARQTDPILRRADSIFDHVKARTPGFSSSLPPRRNIWGEPIFLDGGLGPDFISPLYSHRVNPDLASTEVVRVGARLSKPKDVIKGVQLDSGERDKLEEITGRLAKTMVDRLVVSPEYQRAPKPIQKELIENLYSKARGVARTQLFTSILTHDPGRYEKVVEKMLKGLTEEQGQ